MQIISNICCIGEQATATQLDHINLGTVYVNILINQLANVSKLNITSINSNIFHVYFFTLQKTVISFRLY